MAVDQSNSRNSTLARGLLSYLLLMYLIWFPLHLQMHGLHASGSSSQQTEEEGNLPLEESCQICDWWVQQAVVEEPAFAEINLNCTELSYPLPAYSIPYVEVATQLSPRAPPALG